MLTFQIKNSIFIIFEKDKFLQINTNFKTVKIH